MKINNSTVTFLTVFLMLVSIVAPAQETFYGITSIEKIPTTPTKDLKRQGSCWSNAGAALLEAEILRISKKETDLSEMGFIHNSYVQKADFYLKSKGKIRIKEEGIASDVIKSFGEFGMVPETGFMKSEKDPFAADAGQMDAILEGTLRMVVDKENGNFSERWKNIFDGALLGYIGQPMINFKYNEVDFTPISFTLKSGLDADDYVLISSDNTKEMYKSFVIPMKGNWSDEKAFNVAPDELAKIMKSSVEKGFPVVWCGDIVTKMVFADENIALVPAAKMPGVKADENEVLVKEPVTEKIISPAERQEKYNAALKTDLGYMLVFGLNKDKKNNEYLLAKKVCESGNSELNLSEAYIKLNTVYLLLNKNSLPADVKTKLGL